MSREQKHVIYVLNDMKILVTGAKGFVGRNLCAQLRSLHQVYEYDIDSSFEDLDRYCKDCDFVFNLAGVNRPDDPDEFMRGNYGFASILLDTLKKHGNRCPVMLSSSVQAGLKGRFAGSEYGKSKRAGEELFLQYERATGVKILIYRFPNIFGKWCRLGYNSVVATFCHNIANDLPIRVDDPEAELELLYIDDLVDELISALSVAISFSFALSSFAMATAFCGSAETLPTLNVSAVAKRRLFFSSIYLRTFLPVTA